MKTLAVLLFLALSAPALETPTIIVNRVDMGKLREMGIPGVPVNAQDQIQVIVKRSGPTITAVRVTAEVLVDGETVKLNQIQECKDWYPLFVIPVKSASRARIVSLRVTELTDAGLIERSDF